MGPGEDLCRHAHLGRACRRSLIIESLNAIFFNGAVDVQSFNLVPLTRLILQVRKPYFMLQ